MVGVSIKQVFIPIPILVKYFSWFFSEDDNLFFENFVQWEGKNFFKDCYCIPSQVQIDPDLRFCIYILTLSFKIKKEKKL
jgi:hypothetical protein